MKPLGKLEIYPATDLSLPGWSFIQPITTSHISGHYFIDSNGKNPNIHFDIYSCKPFKWHKIIKILKKEILITKWKANILNRDLEARKMISSSDQDFLP